MQYDLTGTISALERCLTTAIDPSYGLTPPQMRDVMEMFISLMHMRKVTLEFWVETLSIPMRGLELSLQVEVEARMKRTPDLPEGVVKRLDDAIDLSLQEISSLRKDLLVKLELLKKCPMPGATIH